MPHLLKVFYNQIALFIPRAFSGICILAGFWIGGLILKVVITRAGRRTRVEPGLIHLLARTAQILTIVFGVVTSLGTMGVNVGALIAGLGLSSFALGLAFKDALSNLLAGISILLYRPFRIGDRILVGGLEGIVTEIDLRYVTLDAEEKKILLPNSNIFTAAVVVFRRPPVRQPLGPPVL